MSESSLKVDQDQHHLKCFQIRFFFFLKQSSFVFFKLHKRFSHSVMLPRLSAPNNIAHYTVDSIEELIAADTGHVEMNIVTWYIMRG